MPKGTSEIVQNKVIKKLTEKNCQIISFEKGRKIKYICSCGNQAETYISNISRESWGGCAKCSNQRLGNMNKYENARKVFEEGGETLPIQEYKGNKVKLFYTCSNCKEEAHVSLSEFKRGRRCEQCAKSRAKETNLKKYGVENVFQSEIIKKKIKETCKKKYGVTHHMKLRCVLDKAIQTNMKRYGIGFAFHSEDSKLKGCATCKEKYGKEFPLQVKKIQEKIKQVCRENLGVDYPLQSKKIQEKILVTFQTKYGMDKYEYLRESIEKSMMEKYGVKNPMQSYEVRDKCKKTMVKRYGVEHAFQSEEIMKKVKKTMMEKYGVEHAMQNIGLFNKMIESCFKTKLYTFPNGRVEYCQGYEPQCLNYLNTLYEEDDIIVGSHSIPPIWYDNLETLKQSRYYPDIYIISENMVIEVKSWWTFKKDYDKNIAKFKRVANLGFKMVLYICDKKDVLEKRIYRPDNSVIIGSAHPAQIVFVD